MTLYDIDDEEGEVVVKNLAWNSDYSGHSFDIFEKKVVPCLRGEAVICITWEGGDMIEGYRIKDGKLTKGKMRFDFESED